MEFTIARASFEQLDAARARRLNKVPTSFTLPAASVDTLIQAGDDVLKANVAHKNLPTRSVAAPEADTGRTLAFARARR